MTFGPVLPPSEAAFDAVAETARRARDAIAPHCGEPLVERRLFRHD